MYHIDFDSAAILPCLRNAFSNIIDGEFKLCNWSILMTYDGVMKRIVLAENVAKLKDSLLDREMVSQLRDSATHNDATSSFKSPNPHIIFLWW